MTSIGSSAFANCAALTDINIPAGVTEISGNAFRGCSGLTSIVIPAGVTSIGSNAFYGCTGLTSIDIPAGVTSIGNGAFEGCSSLAVANIPANVTSIGTWAFSGTSLTTVSLPAGVTSIGSSAFRECASLTTVSLPSSVTSVGSYAFRDCSNLASVCIFAPSLSTYGSNAFNGNAAERKIYVPAASVDTYKSGWSAYQNDILPMSFHTVRLAAGTVDSALWTLTPADTVIAGQPLTATYSGNRKVKSVKAVKYVAPTITVDGLVLNGQDGDSWETLVANNPGKIELASGQVYRLSDEAILMDGECGGASTNPVSSSTTYNASWADEYHWCE